MLDVPSNPPTGPDLDRRRLDDFARRLAALPSRRIHQGALWGVFQDAFPHRPRGEEPRPWLLAALRDAAARGVIRLPPPHGVRWDHLYAPALPRCVDRIEAPKPPPDEAWRRRPWHPRLQSWVPRLKRLAPGQESFLLKVNEGLFHRWFKQPAPFKYRSLQLTGHEKALGALRKTVLFGDDRLSLELLGCTPDTLPLVWESVGASSAMLVFENAAAFATALRVLRNRPHAPYGMVAWGGGDAFVQSIRHLLNLDRPLTTIAYVGDLDRPGLENAQAAAVAARRAGLPPVEPAPGVHRAMLESAQRLGYPTGMEYPRHASADQDTALVTWLPMDVRAEVIAMLAIHRRVPEEVLGPEELNRWLNQPQLVDHP